MSRKRSGAERRASRNRNRKASLGDSVGDTVPELPVGGVAESHQGIAPADEQQSKETASEDSPWWRELSPENVAKANALGMGAAVALMKERRLELRAVIENWPISRDMRERIVYESIMVVLDKNADPRLKQRERWMLHKMAEANKPNGGLPAQVEIESTANRMSTRQIIDAVLNDEAMGIVDSREWKVVPGSDDDYAE